MLTGNGEEDEVLVTRLGELGNEGLAGDGQAVVVGVVAEVLLGLTADGKGLGVEGRRAAVPEDRAVGLAGLEVAEVAAATSATTTTSAGSTKAAAWTTEESATATALAWSLAKLLELLLVFKALAEIAHPCEGIRGSSLSGNGDRITREVGISRDGRQRRAGVGRSTSRLKQVARSA